MSVAAVEEDSQSVVGDRRPRWWKVAAGGIALVLVPMLGVAAWWVTHPDVLYPLGNGVGAHSLVGATVAFDTAIVADRNQYGTPSEPATVVIHRVNPVITTNTADAEVSVLLCEGPRAGGIGAVAGTEVSQYCTKTTPVTDGSLITFNNMHGQQLIVLITPRSPGVVVVSGFEVTYRDGLRRGTQLSGINVKVRARVS